MSKTITYISIINRLVGTFKLHELDKKFPNATYTEMLMKLTGQTVYNIDCLDENTPQCILNKLNYLIPVGDAFWDEWDEDIKFSGYWYIGIEDPKTFDTFEKHLAPRNKPGARKLNINKKNDINHKLYNANNNDLITWDNESIYYICLPVDDDLHLYDDIENCEHTFNHEIIEVDNQKYHLFTSLMTSTRYGCYIY